MGSSRSDCPCPARSSRRCQRAPSPTATLHQSVEVSSARIRILRILLDPDVPPPRYPEKPRRSQLQSNVAPSRTPSMSANPNALHPSASRGIATVDSLDQEGRGIARVDGKAI